jgi:galactokinase
VITECARVDEARAALLGGELERFGAVLDAGHASLRDDFEVSTPTIERVREAARALPGVAGSRLVGGGFGGCLVVAHDPGARVQVPGLWCERLEPGGGARLG